LQKFWPVYSAESSEAKVNQLKFAEILASFQYRKLRRKSETIKNLPTLLPVFLTESSEAKVELLKFAKILFSFLYRKITSKS
jgi:hypothetical protein